MTFSDIAHLAAKQMPPTPYYHPNVVNDSTKPEGVFARVADVTKMRQFYQPKVSLAEGIRRSLDFASR